MKNRTANKRLLILLAVALIFLFYNHATLSNFETFTETPARTEPVGEKKLIYFCRLENEEIPAVQIFEVTDDLGQVTGTLGRIDAGNGLEFFVTKAPVWSFKTVTARSAENAVEVIYEPHGTGEDYDWTLTLADDDRFFKARVRDCQEIADE